MKKWGSFILLLVMMVGLLIGCEQVNQQVKELDSLLSSKETAASKIQKPKKVAQVKVLEVIDGDTIVVNLNGKKEKVRFVLVDTPETKHPTKPVQPFGPEASAFTKKQLSGQTIDLEFDVQERDKYGRVLAYIWKGNELFNVTLLEKGFARVAVFPPNTRYMDQFKEVEKIAKEKKQGLWSAENDYSSKK